MIGPFDRTRSSSKYDSFTVQSLRLTYVKRWRQRTSFWRGAPGRVKANWGSYTPNRTQASVTGIIWFCVPNAADCSHGVMSSQQDFPPYFKLLNLLFQLSAPSFEGRILPSDLLKLFRRQTADQRR